MEDNKLPLKLYDLREGDRVLVNCQIEGKELKNAPATVVYIQKTELFKHENLPIQVVLDVAYDENEHTTIRLNLKEVFPYAD